MNFKLLPFCVGSLAFSYLVNAEELAYKYSGVHYDTTSEQYFVNDKPKLNIQATNGTKFLDRIEYSLDDAAFAPYSSSIKFNQEGLHTLRFKAVDPVNNWSPVQSFRIFVDLTKPVSQTSWSGDSFVNSGKTFISPRSKAVISANDNLSGVSRILWKNTSGQVAEYKTPLSFDKDGEHKIELAAIDNVGNIEPWKVETITMDSTLPTSSIKTKGESFKTEKKLYTQLGALLEITSADTGSGVKDIEIKINDGESQKYERPIALDKKFTKVQFRGIDNVGNTEKWQEFEIYVDTDAPDVEVAKVGRYQNLSGKIFASPGFKIEITATDKESLLRGVLINGAEKAITGKETMVFDKEGTSDVSIVALDNVGNKSTVQNFSIVIDNTPPVSKFSTSVPLVEKEGIMYSSVPNKLMIASEDAGVGVQQIEMSYDGKTYSKLTDAIDLTTWKEQQQTVFYRAKDNLGNIEVDKKLVIAIRDKGPSVGLFVEADELGNIPLSEVKGAHGKSVANDRASASTQVKEATVAEKTVTTKAILPNVKAKGKVAEKIKGKK